MSALIGAIRVSLSMDTAAFEKGADIAQKRAAAMGKNLQGMGDKLSGIGTKLSVGLTLPFTALLTKAIPAALESREAIGQVNAALKSMGPVAGFSADQLQKMAGQLQHISTFDDDEILKKVTANMLTFGNVSGEVFERAQVAAVNLSARLGQDLQSSAIQVGKALNDPIKGLTALRRVGIQFTQEQQEQIKAMVAAGDTLGAQKIILSELEREFNGSAKAMRDASPAADLQEKWRTFQEVIGEVALKVLPPLTNFLTKLLQAFNSLSPSMQTVVVGAVALSAALGPILIVVGQMVSITGGLLPLILKLGPAFGGLVTVLKALGPVLTVIRVGMLALLGNPILLGAAAVIVGVYLAWRNWDKIVPIVQKMVAGVTSWLQRLAAPFEWVANKLKWVGDKFHELYDRVVGHSYIPDMVDEIGVHIARLDELMIGPVQAKIDAVNKAFESIGQTGPIALFNNLKTIAEQANEAMSHIAEDGIRSLSDGLAAVITGTAKLGDVFRSVAQQIIADLLRIQIEKMLLSFATSIGIPLPGITGARAAGGPVMAGGAYLVGERGPEIFMPHASGEIVPNHKIGGGVTNFNVSVNGAMSDAQARRTGTQIYAGFAAEQARARTKGIR